MNKPKFCRHYDGRKALIEPKTCCGAGVRYDSFGDPFGIAMRRPCAQGIDRKGEKEMPCDKIDLYTEQEIAERKKQLDEKMEQIFGLNKIVNEWRVFPHPSQDRFETIICPICAGQLHLKQSAYNGHVAGKCETENCVFWME